MGELPSPLIIGFESIGIAALCWVTFNIRAAQIKPNHTKSWFGTSFLFFVIERFQSVVWIHWIKSC